jgi:hypothetical protein
LLGAIREGLTSLWRINPVQPDLFCFAVSHDPDGVAI